MPQETEEISEHEDDEFLSWIAHEVRTSLTVILFNAQILQHLIKKENLEQQRQHQFVQEFTLLDKVVHHADQANRLLIEMMDAIRLRRNRLRFQNKEINVIALVREIVERQIAQGHPMQLQTAEDILPVTCDAIRIAQVIHTLIRNASGRQSLPIVVTVKQRIATSTEAIITIHEEGCEPGTSESIPFFESFDQILVRNETIEESLGLYIAHGIVVQQGGQMWHENQSEQARIWSISLPLKS